MLGNNVVDSMIRKMYYRSVNKYFRSIFSKGGYETNQQENKHDDDFFHILILLFILNNGDSHRRKVLRCLNDGRFRNTGNDDERDAEYNNANELLILFYHETIAPIFMYLFKKRRRGASLRRFLSVRMRD